MAFTDIKEAFINIDDDFSTDEKTAILNALELAYNKSSTFRGMIDTWTIRLITRTVAQSLNISTQNWVVLTTQFRRRYHGAVGHVDVLTESCQHLQLKKRATVSICQRLLA